MDLLISFGVSSSERLLEQLPLFWAPSGPFGAPFLPLPGQLRRLYGGPVPGRPHLEISKTCLSNTHTHPHTHSKKNILPRDGGKNYKQVFCFVFRLDRCCSSSACAFASAPRHAPLANPSRPLFVLFTSCLCVLSLVS